MKWHKETIEIHTQGKGLYNITAQIEQAIHQWGVVEGICHLFVQHTSASLVASESYDPSARKDLEAFFEKKVYLGLFVKVDKDWKNKQHSLKKFGYQ